MQLDKNTGRIVEACWKPSPNQDARPHPGFINTLVVHAISLPPEKFGNCYVEDFFCNQLDVDEDPYFETIAHLKVSAHFYIKRSGELTQFVSTHHRAWHAGISTLSGQSTVNDFSIGIELEGSDDQAFLEPQYATLQALCQCLISAYPAISQNRVVGHSDIAPGRKTDPGPNFDWPRLHKSLLA